MMSNNTPILVWLRNDLRLGDNPGLSRAARWKRPVIPVFIWFPEFEGKRPPGAASRVWLHESLKALDATLRRRKHRLIVRSGEPRKVLSALADETGASHVIWNRRYEPHLSKLDRSVASALRGKGLHVFEESGNLLYEPGEVLTGQGTPYKVFTPFWRACQVVPPIPEPLPSPRSLRAPKRWPKSDTLSSLGLRPRLPWDAGILSAWRMGEAEARRKLRAFIANAIEDYPTDRDFPQRVGVSHLSPHLHFGEISVREIWHAVAEAVEPSVGEPFLRQLAWRDFAHHVLHFFPHTTEKPLQEKFRAFQWRRSKQDLKLWQQGRTGYPFVDAAMRELWHTGYMHNRARMVVASFLVKDLQISWRAGATWFWNTLVDADLANNTFGWQWAGGCGADAAPYFRVFNPVTQGKKFDPDGGYVRRWIPELRELPARWIHEPWDASADVLQSAGVSLGKNYPFPMVEHDVARREALARFGALKSTG